MGKGLRLQAQASSCREFTKARSRCKIVKCLPGEARYSLECVLRWPPKTVWMSSHVATNTRAGEKWGGDRTPFSGFGMKEIRIASLKSEFLHEHRWLALGLLPTLVENR